MALLRFRLRYRNYFLERLVKILRIVRSPYFFRHSDETLVAFSIGEFGLCLGLFAHLCVSRWVIHMPIAAIIVLTIGEAIAIISAIVALVFARRASVACTSAAEAARLINSICSELEASLRRSEARFLSPSQLAARYIKPGGIRP